MRFDIEKSNFLKYLEQAVSCISAKNTNPVTEGILLKAQDGYLTLLTYDLEKGIRIILPVEACENGTVIVDALRFKAIIANMPETLLTIAVDEKKLMSITGNDSYMQILTIDSGDFPSLPEINGEVFFTLTQDKLKRLIEKTIFCVSNDESRPVYSGTLFEIKGKNITAAAVNSASLACAEEYGMTNDDKITQRIVIPAKTQGVLLKIINDTDAEISVAVARKHIIFTLDNIYFIARLLNSDEFMDYTRKLPDGFATKISVKKSLLIDSIERAGLVLDEKNVRNFLKLTISDSELQIKCDTETGKLNDSIAIKTEGSNLFIGFNHRLLLELIRMCSGESIEMDFNGENSAVIIKNFQEEKDGEGKYFYLLMPVRMD